MQKLDLTAKQNKTKQKTNTHKTCDLYQKILT